MLTRLLAILVLTALPITALADDTTDPSAPADTPAAESPAPDAGASSSNNYMLGPSTGAAATTPSGGSHSDVPSLQPAGQSPLQSTTSDASGLAAPNTSPLQAPAASDEQLRVLQGEADGSPVDVAGSSGPSLWGWAAITLVIALIVAGAALAARRFPRLLSPRLRISRPRLRLRMPKLRFASQPVRHKTKRKSRRKSRR